MKNIVIFSSILLLISACQEKHADYQLRILIRNETDSLMTVILYPKEKYMIAGKYTYSDILLLNKDTTFIPDTKLGSELFVTDNLTMEPQILAAKIFDSINIRYSSGRIVLRFSPQRVINYSRNMFTDISAWVYEKNRFERIKMWRDNYIESDDYIFIIRNGN